MTKTALIGSTGFVGSHLLRSQSFTHLYNSKNIEDIRGQSFDSIYCAGVYAAKWWANQNPDDDFKKITPLLESLKKVKCQNFILISTIDVYPHPNGVDENSPINQSECHHYGRHRLHVENWVKDNFKTTTIVRLPGLFGSGLKKNVIFDLFNKNGLETLQPLSRFQYYNLEHLGQDIKKIIDLKLPLINITSEPIATQEIQKVFFPNLSLGAKAGPPVAYDTRSLHASHWGTSQTYMYSKKTVLKELERFYQTLGYSHAT